MQVEVITIGDEILIGQTLDTNSGWMGRILNKHGFTVSRVTSIGDEPGEIKNCLTDCLSRVKIVLITGGLGPTKDDLTKHTLAEYFGTKLIMNEEVLQRVESFFSKLGRPMLESNRMQALMPENCQVLPNLKGTASGMCFEKDGALIISMPGVPYEMEHLMEAQVLPLLKTKFKAGTVVHKTIVTVGIGESFLAEKIAEWEDNLSNAGFKLAYLPSPGMVKLRISAYSGVEADLNQKITSYLEQLYRLIPEFIYGDEDESLELVIGKLLLTSGKTLATAESCTGGNIARLITSISGASGYFKGSAVVYSNEIKNKVLGVSLDLIDEHGAESIAVVEEMAIQARKVFNTDYAVATSGFAGPDGGTPEKPVGTIYFAVASNNGVISDSQKFGSDRLRNIERSTIAVLNLLRKELVKDVEN